MYSHFFKRILDIVISLLGIIILAPLFGVLFIFLFVSNNGKVFFLQERPGKNEMHIKIIKFKTMNDEKNEKGKLLPDNERLTKVGNFCRSLSLDELPQLFNVLLGQMSLVGPRPLLFKYLPLYNSTQKRRHEVRPGITGWAQVNGRNNISWENKFDLDVYYVDNISFTLDLKILCLTFLKVLKREGVQLPPSPFNGNN